MKIQMAAALLAVTAPGLAGAAVLQGSATAQPVTHTRHLILNETASHQLGRNHFVGTDRIRARASHRVVGYDSFTGRFVPRKQHVELQAAFAFKRGIVVVRVHSLGNSPRFRGHIIRGTGIYTGATGTLRGRALKGDRTLVTLTWTS